MTELTALGLVAATLTTCSFVPQLTRVVRTRSAEDLSYGMFGAFSLGVLLWLIYGARTHPRGTVRPSMDATTNHGARR